MLHNGSECLHLRKLNPRNDKDRPSLKHEPLKISHCGSYYNAMVPIHWLGVSVLQWSGTRTGSAIPAVRFNCIRTQTFNVVVYGEYTENCKLPFASTNRKCHYSRIKQQQRIQRSLSDSTWTEEHHRHKEKRSMMLKFLETMKLWPDWFQTLFGVTCTFCGAISSFLKQWPPGFTEHRLDTVIVL